MITKEYADGTSAVLEIGGTGEIETRFPGGDLHYESSDSELPTFIPEGHEDIQRNN